MVSGDGSSSSLETVLSRGKRKAICWLTRFGWRPYPLIRSMPPVSGLTWISKNSFRNNKSSARATSMSDDSERPPVVGSQQYPAAGRSTIARRPLEVS